MNENTKTELLHPDVTEKLIWTEIIDWINSEETLKSETRESLLKRMPDLRLKLQALFVEIQKKIVTHLAYDVEFEGEFRRQMRINLPYMTPLERATTLKALIDTNEDRISRLERQLAGFDLFSNVEFALSTMSEDEKVSLSVQDRVKKLPPLKRRNLLTIINEMKTQLESEIPKELQDNSNNNE